MHLYKFFASSLLSAGIMMTSCSSEQIEIPNDEFYAREFIKQFGVADPNHDWNNSAKGTVTVVTSSPTHVQVLADIKGKRYIFADYKNVNGKETINFTTPKSVTELIVTLNGRQFKTSIGGTVNASKGSRAIWDDKTKDPLVSITRRPYREISDKAVLSFPEKLPEEKDNRGEVTQNFSYIANGPFTVYPVFWNTSAYNTLGIYYIKNEGKDNETMVYVPFYTNKIQRSQLSDGNLEYYKYSNLYPALESKWYNHENEWGLVINDSYANKYVSEKSSFGDYSDADWETFKNKIIEEYQNPEQNSLWYYGIQFQGYTETQKEQIRLTDIKYTIHVPQHEWESYSVGINQVYITGCEEYQDGDWIYPAGRETSHPNLKDYLNYKEQGYTYEEIAGLMEELPVKWHSEGINIDIKEGTRFGMFIRHETSAPNEESIQVREVEMIYDETLGYKMPKPDGYERMYSQSKYNTDKMDDPKNPGTQINSVHAATYIYEAPSKIKYQVLGFEDWYNANVYDINDMVFFIDSDNPLEIPDIKDEDHPDPEPEKYEYLIAAEDLGGTCDWDFNDLVASVSLMTKNYSDDATDGTKFPYTEVTVTPLAAGGTLPVYLMYTGKISTSKDDYASATPQDYMLVNEFHSWLTGNDGTTPYPINVGESASLKGKSITFHVPGNGYTLGMHQKYNASDGKNNMGGFWVLAINDKDAAFSPDFGNGDLHPQTTLPEGEGKGITKIEAPTADQNVNSIAPQMICVGSEWLWPREGKKIHTAYTIFNNWVTDPTKTEWYGEGKYVESLVTKR